MSDFTTARRKMVDGQVRTRDVTDLAVIDAMLDVPREAFVPEDRRSMAYLDLELDVAPAGSPPRRLMKPMVIARLLQAATITPENQVLVAGCATGYTVALVARLASRVVGAESDASLADSARFNLARSGFENCVIVTAASAEGAAGNGPFDVIVLDGATEIEPTGLYHQLKMGGRLVGVVVSADGPRATIVTRTDEEFGRRSLFDASATVLPGLERRPVFVF